MFTSKQPGHVERDPFPHRIGGGRHEFEGSLDGVWSVYDPRPEYRTPVNLILQAVRAETTGGNYNEWLDSLGYVHVPELGETPEMERHAYRVLTLLATLSDDV